MKYFRCPQCRVKCGTHFVPYDVLRSLWMGFRRLEHSNSKSLLKKFLTEEMLESLKFRETHHHVNLYDCIKCGLENDELEVGAIACDPESYFTFAQVFEPILEMIHGFGPDNIHPKSKWSLSESMEKLDKSDYPNIESCRIRVVRNLKGFPFTPYMDPAHYEEIEDFLAMVLSLGTDDLDGTYEKIGDMNEIRTKELQRKNLLFDDKNHIYGDSGVYRYWPIGRGIFLNQSETFLVWVNSKDHVKIISQEKGGNLKSVYARLKRAVKLMSHDLNFVYSKRMGYVTLSPADMGTGMKASIQIYLPNLIQDYEKLEQDVESLDVSIKKLTEDIEDEDYGMVEIYNKKRMGINESEIVAKLEHAAVCLVSLDREFDDEYE